MRVIRGSARGRQLQSVRGETTRPITDRVKEALFNIIGADIEGASLLDLFAGTGSVGIEALSCGAEFALFVDIHRTAINTIKANLSATSLASKAQVLQKNALLLLQEKPLRPFDYIYVAPPQYQGLWKDALWLLDEHSDWLAKDAWVIVQIDFKEYEELSLQKLQSFDQRRYGDTLLVFYRLSEKDRETGE